MNYTKIAAGLLCGIILMGSVAAASTQGGQDDPLVTLSYLTDVLTPKLESEVTKAVAANEKALTDKLDASIKAYQTQVDALLQQGGGSAAAGFQPLTLEIGKTKLGLGEYLLRSGGATAEGELLDSTAGTLLAKGGALTANHLYIAVDSASGVKATGSATLLIKGN